MAFEKEVKGFTKALLSQVRLKAREWYKFQNKLCCRERESAKRNPD